MKSAAALYLMSVSGRRFPSTFPTIMARPSAMTIPSVLPNHTPEKIRSISHTLSRVQSGGDAVHLRVFADDEPRKDASPCEAFLYPWTPRSIFYTLQAIARSMFWQPWH